MTPSHPTHRARRTGLVTATALALLLGSAAHARTTEAQPRLDRLVAGQPLGDRSIRADGAMPDTVLRTDRLDRGRTDTVMPDTARTDRALDRTDGRGSDADARGGDRGSDVTGSYPDASMPRGDGQDSGSLDGAAVDRLLNRQANGGTITSAVTLGSDRTDGLTGRPLDASSLSVSDNRTSSLAIGNTADNAVSRDTIAGTVGSPMPEVGLMAATGAAGGTLRNDQRNAGTVTAAITGDGSPLNAAVGDIRGSSVSLAGNAVDASGYGNSASNLVTLTGAGSIPAETLTNSQGNAGAVTARATSPGYTGSAGLVADSRLAVTGNSLAATAVGNQASSAIASPR